MILCDDFQTWGVVSKPKPIVKSRFPADTEKFREIVSWKKTIWRNVGDLQLGTLVFQFNIIVDRIVDELVSLTISIKMKMKSRILDDPFFIQKRLSDQAADRNEGWRDEVRSLLVLLAVPILPPSLRP